MRKTLIVCVAFLILLSTYSFSEEAAFESFQPRFAPGAQCEGTVSTEGRLSVKIAIRDMPVNGHDWEYSTNADYRQQVLTVNNEGQPASVVRFYKKAAFSLDLDQKKSSYTTNLKGNKRYINTLIDPVDIRPGKAASSTDRAMLLLDFGDPVRATLPKVMINKNLEWEVEADLIDAIFEKMAKLRTPEVAVAPVPDDEKEAEIHPGVLAERGRGRGKGGGKGGGKGPKWNDRDIKVDAIEARGYIRRIKLDSFDAEIIFKGNLMFPVDIYDWFYIPIEGSMTYCYDTQRAALKTVELSAAAALTTQIEWNETTTPITLDWHESLRLERETGQVLGDVNGPLSKVMFGQYGGETNQLLICEPGEQSMKLFANWDGGNKYEVLNRGSSLHEPNPATFSSAVSADGKNMMLAFPGKLYISNDFGESFVPCPWKGGDIGDIQFINSDTCSMVIRTTDGGLSIGEYKSGKLTCKAFPTFGGAVFNVWTCPEPESLLMVTEKCYTVSHDCGKKWKDIKLTPTSLPTIACRTSEGLIVLTPEGLFLLKDDGFVKVTVEGLPEGIKCMTSYVGALYMLTDKNELFTAPLVGGKAGPYDKDVFGVATAFTRLFLSKHNGVTIR